MQHYCHMVLYMRTSFFEISRRPEGATLYFILRESTGNWRYFSPRNLDRSTTMDFQNIVEILQATIDHNVRQQAEEKLSEMHKIIGFAPLLLQVVMTDQVAMPVRQAGVIYLKNMISQYWHERHSNVGEPLVFNIHEQDRTLIRNNLVEAIIQAPDLVRVQLGTCMSHILKHDYPGRWHDVIQKLNSYITSDQPNTWLGALLSIYQLVKNYEYKKPEERAPLNAAMTVFLPVLHQRLVQLIPDQSEASVLIQKQILKIFYALIQYFLQQDLVTRPIFQQWMEALKQIMERAIPEQTLQIDEDERPDLPWWKCKKWAMHILARVFERYGSPGNVTKEYNSFAEWYIKTFSAGILTVLLKVLDGYRRKQYVTPRVVQQTLNYLNTGVSHAVCWKVLKPHMVDVIREVVFPLMCYTDEDDLLWKEDPYEYIRMKFDVFEDFVSPVTAAQTLLHSTTSKRKDVLQKTMGFCMQALTDTTTDPRQKDGALHMIGTCADILLKKKIYKDQMESMLQNYVFPLFRNELGYMRARACWVLHYFCEVQWKSEGNLKSALELVHMCLTQEKEMPVKVEAAIALQMLITHQPKAKEFVEPHVRPVIQELLVIIRETENDDLTTVMQKLICTYTEQCAIIAVEMTQHLADTFAQCIDSEDSGNEDKAITAMGLLNTIETILTVMEDHKEIMIHLEGVVLKVVGLVLQQQVLEFYEEILSLIYSLTCSSVSQNMWQVLYLLYENFKEVAFDYFTEMMPCLHNYITVDTQAFLSSPKHLEIVYNMSKSILTSGEAGEDAECHAAKLLEVSLIQCKGVGNIDQCVPLFVELALERLTREVKTSELRTMCLQVVIAALFYNTPLLVETLEKMRLPNSSEAITTQFISQWFRDTDCFLGLHDRKLCVLGLCALMELQTRPEPISSAAQSFLPALLMLFEGLKRAYAHKASLEEGENDDDDDGEEDEDYDGEELASDEDEIDEDGQEYLEALAKRAGELDDEDWDDDAEETPLESYLTPLDEDDCTVDEFVIFKSVMQTLQSREPVWYNALTSHLNEEQLKELQEVIVMADQRQAAAESKRIEQQGGYQFAQQNVPNAFNFGTPVTFTGGSKS
ncbi:IPO7 [Branchiostoma lanceolatum]|uniref:IPO7 protein n=1 Tax=Branchiostoma lanceolatum TaxID=7740 RepID=A0A8K0EKC7_BRALA|nr:IPO7 [Branchiostoma lanceolatum]